jgi:hypothetical protein
MSQDKMSTKGTHTDGIAAAIKAMQQLYNQNRNQPSRKRVARFLSLSGASRTDRSPKP